jgi:peptide deformylase
VGISLRLFVVDVTNGQDISALKTYINPEIVSAEGRLREEEGCLSVVG